MKEAVRIAVARMGVLRYFPTDPHAQLEIMRLLERMVPHAAALDWLTETLIDRVGEWQGPKELRGILCAKFRPKDGIEEWSTIPGFTASDSEIEQAQPQRYLPAPDDTPNLPERLAINQLAQTKRLQ